MAAIIFLLVLAALWLVVPFVFRKRREGWLVERCAERRAIVLTYDDGPGVDLTPKLLDLLKRHDVHASFYALGRNAVASPELVKRAIAEGHEVGSHTYNHSNAWKTDPFTAFTDVVRGVRIIKALGGDKYAFRPPYGKLTLAGLLQGYLRGFKYGWWTVDSRDSWARRTVADVLAEIERKSGGVVLMHDFDRYDRSPAEPTHVDHVLALTAAIIKLSRDKGFRIVPMSSLRW